MSSCTFLIINKGRAFLISCHYSWIKDCLLGAGSALDVKDNLVDVRYSDTGNFPAFIVDVDHKRVSDTKFNWFISLDDKEVLKCIERGGWKVASWDGEFKD